ncbi:MAG: hypothetical protein ACI88L_000679 [Candidatus Paceibacteria bacterium]|jgi:hypothetical protein
MNKKYTTIKDEKANPLFRIISTHNFFGHKVTEDLMADHLSGHFCMM